VRWMLVFLMMASGTCFVPAQNHSPLEYQLKAVFLFNFTLFTEWPTEAFSTPDTPIVIGVLGDDPFGTHLEEAVRDERVSNRPVIIRRSRRVEELLDSHVLFVSASESARFNSILASVRGRPILTVSDVNGFAKRGGIILFVMDGNKIRLRVNLDAAKTVGLTLSSKLLRPAEIVTTERN
jgi:hypothetical protein